MKTAAAQQQALSISFFALSAGCGERYRTSRSVEFTSKPAKQLPVTALTAGEQQEARATDTNSAEKHW